MKIDPLAMSSNNGPKPCSEAEEINCALKKRGKFAMQRILNHVGGDSDLAMNIYNKRLSLRKEHQLDDLRLTLVRNDVRLDSQTQQLEELRHHFRITLDAGTVRGQLVQIEHWTVEDIKLRTSRPKRIEHDILYMCETRELELDRMGPSAQILRLFDLKHAQFSVNLAAWKEKVHHARLVNGAYPGTYSKVIFINSGPMVAAMRSVTSGEQVDDFVEFMPFPYSIERLAGLIAQRGMHEHAALMPETDGQLMVHKLEEQALLGPCSWKWDSDSSVEFSAYLIVGTTVTRLTKEKCTQHEGSCDKKGLVWLRWINRNLIMQARVDVQLSGPGLRQGPPLG